MEPATGKESLPDFQSSSQHSFNIRGMKNMASGEGGGQTGHMGKQVRKGNVRGSEAMGRGGETAQAWLIGLGVGKEVSITAWP